MKRKIALALLGLIIIIVAVFIALPYFIGVAVEKNVKQSIQDLNAKNTNTKVTLTNYTRHWFNTDAETKLTLVLPNMITGLSQQYPLHVTVQEHVSHGPVVNYIENGKRQFKLAKTAIKLTGADGTQGSALILVDWHNNVDVTLNLKQFSDKNSAHTVELKNLIGHLTYNAGLQSIKYHYTLGELNQKNTLQSNTQNAILIKNHKATGSLKKDGDIWVGTKDSERGLISIKRDNKTMASVSNANTSINSEVVDNKLDWNITLTTDSSVFANQTLGPLSLNASAKGIATEPLTQIKDILKSINPKRTPAVLTLMALYNPALQALQQGLSIQNFLTFKVPDQTPIQINIAVKVAPNKETNLISLLNKDVNVRGKINMPLLILTDELTNYYQHKQLQHKNIKPILTAKQEAKQAITDWIKHKLILEKPNQALETAFSFQQGKLLVNGEKPDFNTKK